MLTLNEKAQGFVVLATYGLGMLIGSQVAGYLFNGMITATGKEALAQWQNFWWVPAILVAVVLVFFAIFFNDKEVDKKVV